MCCSVCKVCMQWQNSVFLNHFEVRNYRLQFKIKKSDIILKEDIG